MEVAGGFLVAGATICAFQVPDLLGNDSGPSVKFPPLSQRYE
jgi:hypothetical protein